MAGELARARAVIVELERECAKLQKGYVEGMQEIAMLRRLLNQGYFDAAEGHYQIVRCNPNGSVDEVVVNHAGVHLEEMGTGDVWIGVSRPEGMLHIDLHSSRRIRCCVRDEGLVTPGMYTAYGWTKEPKVSPLLSGKVEG